VQYGFGQLSFTMEHGLLDELRLWVYPLFVGKADPSELLSRHCSRAIFALTDTTTLDNGVVILSCRYPQSDWPERSSNERSAAGPDRR
jgi:hypothetical protein